MAKKKETPKSNQNPFIITKVPDPSENGENEAAMSAARQTISRPGLKLGEHKELVELTLADIVTRKSQTLGRIAHNKVATAATTMARLELDKRRAARESEKKRNRLIVRNEETEEEIVMTDKEQLDESCTHEAYCKYHKRAGAALKDIAGHLDRHSYLTNKVVEKSAKQGYKSHVDHHGMKSIADQLEALQLQLAQDNEFKADMQKPVKVNSIREEVEDLEEERKGAGKVVDAFLGKKSHKEKNTHTDGKALYLHGNKIAWHGEKGEIYATMAGWGTKTTRDRLNTLANRLGKDSFSQKKGSQYHGKNAVSSKAVVKLKEEGGAGEEGTAKLLKKYVEETPGQSAVLKTLKKVVKEAAGDYTELQQKQKAETKTLQKKHVQQDITTQKKVLDDKAKKRMEKIEQ